jgi:predicted outer membrane protein
MKYKNPLLAVFVSSMLFASVSFAGDFLDTNAQNPQSPSTGNQPAQPAGNQPGNQPTAGQPATNQPNSPTGSQPGAGATGQVTELAVLNNAQVLDFLHHMNNLAIKNGQSAQDKIQDPKIRDFLQTMITTHQQNDQQLSQLAKQKNISLSDFSAADYEKSAMDQLDKLQGKNYEMGFLQLATQADQEGVDILKLLLENTQDPDIQSLVNQMIPTIQQHQSEAASLLSLLQQQSQQPQAQPQSSQPTS